MPLVQLKWLLEDTKSDSVRKSSHAERGKGLQPQDKPSKKVDWELVEEETRKSSKEPGFVVWTLASFG